MKEYFLISTLAFFVTTSLYAMESVEDFLKSINLSTQDPAKEQAAVPVQGKSFFSSFMEKSSTIGAVAESSSYLAEEITKYFPEKVNRKPWRILEVGAGNGVFTRALAVKLQPGDTLDVVELTEDFIADLWYEFGDNKSIRIFCEDILKFESTEPYDLIVSGLPFNAFNYDTVFDMLVKYRMMSKEGTVISFFEYSALPILRQTFAPSDEYAATRAVIVTFVKQYEFENNTVLRNIPPAVVHHLSIK